MTKARSRKMPTWQKMHALRSTTAPCSTSNRSKSCSSAIVLTTRPTTTTASTVVYKAVASREGPLPFLRPCSSGDHCRDW